MLTLGALVAVTSVSCTRHHPDESQLGTIVAELVVEPSANTSGKTIVLDSANLESLPYRIAKSPESRAEQTFVKTEVLDLNEDETSLPGEWVDSEVYGEALRRNESHYLLLVFIDGDGSRRRLRWMYLCGRECGWGEEVLLRWNGEQWTPDRVSFQRY